jgi:hypothetical protein
MKCFGSIKMIEPSGNNKKIIIIMKEIKKLSDKQLNDHFFINYQGIDRISKASSKHHHGGQFGGRDRNPGVSQK